MSTNTKYQQEIENFVNGEANFVGFQVLQNEQDTIEVDFNDEYLFTIHVSPDKFEVTDCHETIRDDFLPTMNLSQHRNLYDMLTKAAMVFNHIVESSDEEEGEEGL
jgi:hypothetical protein